MQRCPYVVGNISIAQAHPPAAVVRVQATFTRGCKFQKVLGCVDWVSSSSLAYSRGSRSGAQHQGLGFCFVVC